MISVVLCTHNPRRDYLARALAGLRQQTLPAAEWELLIVDNASREPVRDHADVSWHPAARIIVETELGLTAARVRGIREARGEVLVWVDDDNILAPDYLAVAGRLARESPRLGVWGCGHFTPEWETPPPPEFAPYLHYLAVNCADRDRTSQQLYDYPATPAGAGMCVRADVARRYAASVTSDARRKILGRTGTGLGACEDHDLAFTAIEAGYLTGVFTSLRLTHLMPAARVREDYLLQLVEGHARSTVLLMSLRDPRLRPAGAIQRLRRWRYRRSLGPVDRKIDEARARGERQAWAMVQNSSRRPGVSRA